MAKFPLVHDGMGLIVTCGRKIGRFVERVLSRQFAVLMVVAGINPALSKTLPVDLTKWDFGLNHIYPMSGQWEFYAGKLLTPSDFKDARFEAKYIFVPDSWNRQTNYPSLGFATYRLQIMLPPIHEQLAIYIPIINSAARIWVNGILCAKAGCISEDLKYYKPDLKASFLQVPVQSDQLEIVIQVANYTHFNAGMVSTPELGKTTDLLMKINRTNSIESFFAGSLIAMFIYLLILYFLHRKGKPYLCLALICLGVALRAMVVHGGSFMLPNLIPWVSWEVWKRIEFFSVYSITALFPLYVYRLFPDTSPRWPVKIFSGIGMLLCVTVLLTRQYVYGSLLDFVHLILLGTFTYAVYAILKAKRKGNQDAGVILWGMGVSLPFVLTELLRTSSIIHLNIQFMYMAEFGVLVFLLFQVYLLANHSASSFKKLEVMNQTLEKLVDERSHQLAKANQVKDRLLSVMSHDIKSPLNSLHGILDIYNKGVISSQEFKSYSKKIEGQLANTSLLVDNVLHWTSGQLKGLTINAEELNLWEVVVANVRLFHLPLEQKQITLKIDISKDLFMFFDRNVLNLVLRNLLSNSIKFSYPSGVIMIASTRTSDQLLISVTDAGLGMTKETLEAIQDKHTTVSKIGTASEKGTGLGLMLCREYLDKAGAFIKIDSTPGRGSVFTVVIPSYALSPKLMDLIH